MSDVFMCISKSFNSALSYGIIFISFFVSIYSCTNKVCLVDGWSTIGWRVNMNKMFRYFGNHTVASVLRGMAILLIAIGVIVVCFAYGYGPLGVPVIVAGIVLFFVCDARIISDKNYDNYIMDLVKEGELNSSQKAFEYSFAGYSGKNASNIKTCHDIVRTDRYIKTGINTENGYIKVSLDEVGIDGKRDHQELRLRLGNVYALPLEEKGITYIMLYAAGDEKEELARFPVQKKDFVAEQFCDYVNGHTTRK